MLRPALALLLALSLAGKAAWSAPAPEPDPRRPAEAARDVLERAGFSTRMVELDRSPRILAEGVRGRCRILAGDWPPHGTFAEVYRALGVGLGELRFVRRGAVTTEAPKLRALLEFYLWREQRRIGIEADRAPVIAVASTRDCDIESLGWARAARVSG
ncbi:MAG: hypothetical protein QOI38_363 [Sphingomonadales bacterium]|jgi:hypothetical protein|nr:hypothetical protein [Sphingomonadales bacterium]